jgi:uncharacterized protein with von Willebrand factor type A (vWA) domain
MSTELHTLLGDGADVAGLVATPAAVVEESPTVLRVDRWTRRTGARLAEQWAEVGVEGVTKDDANLATDSLKTLLSSAPRFAERPEEPHRARWWKQLMESPECSALRARTVLSPAIAEIAAAELAKQWVAYAGENPEPKEGEGEGDGDGDGSESVERSVARIRSTREALKEAASAAEDAEAAGAGLGLDAGGSVDARKLASYTRRLRKSGNLVAIMRMAGRFIAKAKRLQRQRTNLPGMEITGVELSGDLSRLLPVESSLVAGAIPELELLALSRFTQRRALSYRRITREPMAMGPIVVSVDESGSMDGAKVEAAKGIALAMASIARAQKRPFMLAAYADDETIRVADGTPDGIVSWCEEFLSGGSDCDLPLSSVRPHWPKGPVGAQADHIIIGDEEVTAATPEYLAEYMAWAKANKVRTFSIIIGRHKPGALGIVSDGGCWCLPSLDLNNPAVDAILSIGPTHKEVRAV